MLNKRWLQSLGLRPRLPFQSRRCFHGMTRLPNLGLESWTRATRSSSLTLRRWRLQRRLAIWKRESWEAKKTKCGGNRSSNSCGNSGAFRTWAQSGTWRWSGTWAGAGWTRSRKTGHFIILYGSDSDTKTNTNTQRKVTPCFHLVIFAVISSSDGAVRWDCLLRGSLVRLHGREEAISTSRVYWPEKLWWDLSIISAGSQTQRQHKRKEAMSTSRASWPEKIWWVSIHQWCWFWRWKGVEGKILMFCQTEMVDAERWE